MPDVPVNDFTSRSLMTRVIPSLMELFTLDFLRAMFFLGEGTAADPNQNMQKDVQTRMETRW